jgi:hypothetical protein
MTIHDYIAKHGLSKWRTWPIFDGNLQRDWTPSFFTSPDTDSEKFDPAEKFEMYANEQHTHFVSLNTTRQMFRIIHYEMIPVISTWESMRSGLDYPELTKL